VEDINTVIVPFLDGVIAVEQAIVSNAASTNQTAKDESSTKIVQLTEAKKGWQSLLDRNLKLYQDARAGKLKTGVTHLVAEALLQDSNGVDNVKYINGTQAPNADALRAISAIRFGKMSCERSNLSIQSSACSFGGNGAVIAYSDSAKNEIEDTVSQSVVNEFEAGARVNALLLVTTLGFTISTEIGYAGSRETVISSTSSSGKTRTRSFALGDPDEGDYFDVQV
jgi:hypothetical protein